MEKERIALAVLLIAVIASGAGCGRDKMTGKKVILIGIDGMDPNITDILMNEGKMPNFEKLKDEGTYSRLKTSNPPHSPVAWASIATSTNPGKHNIFDFIRRDVGSYTPQLSLAKTASGIGGTDYVSYVKATPFWKLTSEAGIGTTVIRWPLTFPAETVNGKLLSGLGVPDVKGFLSGYTYYNEREDGAKSVKVAVKDGVVDTVVKGPKKRKGNEIVDLTVPMQIKLSDNTDKTVITVDGVDYPVKDGWSDFITAKFKIGLFKSVNGIFKAYIISRDPFEMYITTVQFDPKKPIVPISFPKSYSAELADDIGQYYTLGMPEETDGYIDGVIDKEAFLLQIKDIETQREKMFWKEFSKFDDGIYAFVFDASDRVSHVTWEKDNISSAIEEYYIDKDRFLGEVMSKMDKETTLFVFSDHGFTSFDRAVSVNRWLVDNGYMVLTKDDGEAPLFRNVDWSQTKAYSLGFNSLYVNLKGREKQGIVEDRDEVVSEIAEKLGMLSDGNTSVVNKVYDTKELYSGASSADGPDMIVGFNPGYRMSWQNAVGGLTPKVVFENDKVWKGDHLVDLEFVPGVLFANVRLNEGLDDDASEISQMDIIPTVLTIFGIDVPEEMDGKSLMRDRERK